MSTIVPNARFLWPKCSVVPPFISLGFWDTKPIVEIIIGVIYLIIF